MKYLIFIFTLLLSSQSLALSCLMPNVNEVRNNAPDVFLIKIKSITEQTEENCSAYGTAQIEVLKIYKGDIKELSKISEIKFFSDGNNWMEGCIPHLAPTPNEEWIMFKYTTETPQLSQGGDCHIDIDMQVNDAAIKEFEKSNHPVWVKTPSLPKPQDLILYF